MQTFYNGKLETENYNEIMLEKASNNRNFTAPVVIHQNDFFETNSNVDQKITLCKVINNNVEVHRYSRGAKIDGLNVQQTQHGNSELDGSFSGIIGINGGDEFELNLV